MPKTSKSYYLLPKLFGIYHRAFDFFRLLPWRFYRFFKLFFRGFWNLRKMTFRSLVDRPIQKIFYWISEVVIALLEFLGIGEIYETICDFSKPSTRPLKDWEIEMAKSVFGNSINYQRVRIDESAYLGPKQNHFCYVSFYIINSWGTMQNSTLIHELVHVWQYENMGAVYIPRALWAQTTKEGYNYGGKDNLKLFLLKNKTLFDFNLEQQGDIIADYFQLKNGYSTRWGNASVSHLKLYEKIIYEKIEREEEQV